MFNIIIQYYLHATEYMWYILHQNIALSYKKKNGKIVSVLTLSTREFSDTTT